MASRSDRLASLPSLPARRNPRSVVLIGEVPDPDVTGRQTHDHIIATQRFHIGATPSLTEVPGRDTPAGLGDSRLGAAVRTRHPPSSPWGPAADAGPSRRRPRPTR